MINLFRLFNGIDKLISKHLCRFDISYQNLQDDKEGLGIFLYPGGNDNIALSGECVYEVIKVHLQIHSKEKNIEKDLEYLRGLVDVIENEQPDGFQIINVMHIGPKVDLVGKNDKGLYVMTSNYILYYTL